MTEWKTGDVVTADKLNDLEGRAEPEIFIINFRTVDRPSAYIINMRGDKTNKQVTDAINNKKTIIGVFDTGKPSALFGITGYNMVASICVYEGPAFIGTVICRINSDALDDPVLATIAVCSLYPIPDYTDETVGVGSVLTVDVDESGYNKRLAWKTTSTS